MITENNLYSWDGDLPEGIKVRQPISLSELKAILSDPEKGIPGTGFRFSFEDDQIVRGGLFNKQYTDCLVVKNAEHPTDYFYFVFTCRITGNYTFINIYRSGTSNLHRQKNIQQQRKNSDSLFQNILGAVSKTDEAGLNIEEDFYTIVCDAIKEILGV